MQKIGFYTIHEQIYQGQKNTIYKAFDEKRKVNVILKVLNNPYPSPEELAGIENEYNLLKELAGNRGIIKVFELFHHENIPILVFEDVKAIPLNSVLKIGRIDLEAFYDFALQLTGTLEIIHNNDIIHKDIKPANIVVNSDNNRIYLIDFSMAARMDKQSGGNDDGRNDKEGEDEKKAGKDEKDDKKNAMAMEGTLPYLSPEQTGRMNRRVDYRTDFYSLGITFYQMLTRVYPYHYSDELELVHAHLAIEPEAPHKIDSAIPVSLSLVVLKMMAKNAENRYGSARGLLKDLQWCRDNPDAPPEKCIPGRFDPAGTFSIGEKLFGREREKKLLLDVYKKVNRGSKELVLIRGNQGTGKSALAKELDRPGIPGKGNFISGRFDRFYQTVPYSAFIKAFKSLIKKLLTLPQTELDIWKENIEKVLGSIGRLITNVLPDLILITGEQPEVEKLSGQEEVNRFRYLVLNFIRLFCTAEYPLVIFLDDLQWADIGSINLIQTILIDPDLNHLLIIGAFRGDESSEGSLIEILKNNLADEEIKPAEIRLKNLELPDITALLEDSLAVETERSVPLADLLKKKTGGNPFFLRELLTRLYKDGLIYFDKNDKSWQWDLEQIENAGFTDNVIKLMVSKIQKVPPRTISILKTAACIGMRFYFDTLSTACLIAKERIFEDLNPAVAEQMVVIEERSCYFVHEKVREAAYSLCTSDEKISLHYKIAKILYSLEDKRELLLFSIVNQFSRARTLLTEKEKLTVFKLNLRAGIKAKSATAFETALEYFVTAEKLVDTRRLWQTDYELALRFFTQMAAAEYQALNFEKAARLFDIILANSSSLLDSIPVYVIKIEHLSSMHKFNRALDLGVSLLKKLNIVVSPNPSLLSVGLKLAVTYGKVRFRKSDFMLQLPEVEQERVKGAMQVMMQCTPAAVITSPKLLALFVLIFIDLSLKYGNSLYSPFSFIMFGVVVADYLGDIKRGVDLAEAAVRLSEKFESKSIRGKVYFLFSALAHYRYSFDYCLEYVEKAVVYLKEAGDFQYLCVSLIMTVLYNLLKGIPLFKVSALCAEHLAAVKKMQQPVIETYLLIYSNFLRQLIDPASLEQPDWFSSKDPSPKILEPDDKAGLFNYYGYGTLLHFLLYDSKDYKKILYSIKKTSKYVSSAPSHPIVYFFYMAAALVFVSLYRNGIKKRYCARILKKIYRRFKKLGLANRNSYFNKYVLLKAELSGLKKRPPGKTARLFDLAIRTAKRRGFIHEAAIGSERAALFYLSAGIRSSGAHYLKEARYYYKKWGAAAKVGQLEEAYPHILQKRREPGEAGAGDESSSSGSLDRGTVKLDLGSVLKSSQIISGEIRMKVLLEKMIRIVIENSGARYGALILADKDKLNIDASYGVETGELSVLESIPLDESPKVCPAIVRYVQKTLKPLVLHDAFLEGLFVKDPFVKANRIRSILCAPVLKQNVLIGIIYLSNYLASGVFTGERIEIVTILSSQIAVSIENSRLIERMKEQERLKQEMEIARTIQTSLCPEVIRHPELELSALMKPAAQVGGDYYDLLYDGQENLWLAIGDVSGHGVSAGLVMIMAETLINSFVENSSLTEPAGILVEINKTLFKNINDRMKDPNFMTFALLKYEGRGTFLHAGLHLDIIVRRFKTGSCELIETAGFFLGWKDDISDILENSSFTLEPGDLMVLYTDGIIEAKNSDRKQFETGGIIKSLKDNRDKPVEQIKEAILKDTLRWCDNNQADDMTMIVVRMKESQGKIHG